MRPSQREGEKTRFSLKSFFPFFFVLFNSINSLAVFLSLSPFSLSLHPFFFPRTLAQDLGFCSDIARFPGSERERCLCFFFFSLLQTFSSRRRRLSLPLSLQKRRRRDSTEK